MNAQQPSIGLIGLGTMGAALALNIAENGFAIAVFNRTVSRIPEFVAAAGDLGERITPSQSLEEFVAAIARPRRIILMVPAGKVVDDQIAAFDPLLDEGDIIIDCGNANFRDTDRRAEASADRPWEFLGVGVSGGEEGARHGPSIMGGGNKSSWDELAPVFTAISAKHTDGAPCAAWMGEGGDGHFVKMVHNGIEYADMQMIAEIYGLLRDGYGWNSSRIAGLFERWNEGALKSYLVEITAKVAQTTDPLTGKPLLDVILDKAGQKGTGRWTVIEAQHLGAPVPVIEAAVAARNMSAALAMRQKGEAAFGKSARQVSGEPDEDMLEGALIAGKILCYAQGFEMLASASAQFGWKLPLPEVARVWRAGCIIRSSMLDDMASALTRSPGENIVFDSYFSNLLSENADRLRNTAMTAIGHGHPAPSLASGLNWFDQLRASRSTANLIQGQRDFFGLHGFKRLDREGDFHGPWAG